MRVLVTGGADYIGSVTAARLREAGHAVDRFVLSEPTNAYGQARLLTERALGWLGRPRGRWAILRHSNAGGATPGAGEDHERLTAPASATTCTSRIRPMPTCWPWSPSTTTAGWSATSATAPG